MNGPLGHTTVLLHEAVDALLGGPRGARGCFVDGTFGRGGHSRLILSRLEADARLVAFDRDPQAIAEAAALHDPRFAIRHEAFSHLHALPEASASGVLLDWLATAEQASIAEVVRDYGEERFAGPIAKAIVAWREKQGPLTRTAELADLVAGTVKTREPGQHPATRTFQALRIYINAELEELRQALTASLRVLAPGGRLVVISFHSLEDRIVKQFIAQHAKEVYDRRAPFAQPQPMRLSAVARVKPGAAEVAANPRARSAVMRVAERTEAAA